MKSDTQHLPPLALPRRGNSLAFWMSTISAVAVLEALLHAWPLQIAVICVVLGVVFSQDWYLRDESADLRNRGAFIFRPGVVNFMAGAAAGCIIAGMACVAIYCYGLPFPLSSTGILQLSAGLGASIASLFPVVAWCLRAVFLFVGTCATFAS